MAAKKIRDLAVKTGTYTSNGETKNRYENVGSLMKSDDGSVFVLMKRTFNPAGVPVDDGRDQILISAFELRDEADGDRPQRAARPEATGGGNARGGAADDDIPFAPLGRRTAA